MTGLVWRKATRSGTDGACVEVAEVPDGVRVRDSKDPDGPMLSFTTEAWRDLLCRIRKGELEP
jgi:hypothetical protein